MPPRSCSSAGLPILGGFIILIVATLTALSVVLLATLTLLLLVLLLRVPLLLVLLLIGTLRLLISHFNTPQLCEDLAAARIGETLERRVGSTLTATPLELHHSVRRDTMCNLHNITINRSSSLRVSQ